MRAGCPGQSPRLGRGRWLFAKDHSMHRTYARSLTRPLAALLIVASSFGPVVAPVIHADDEDDVSLPAEAMPMDPTSPSDQAPADASSPAFMPLVNTAAVASPEYGMSMFLWGHPDSTSRDLSLATGAGFGWQKTLFQWREIEGDCKGCFNWTEADRVVKATNQAGLKLIARLDFEPMWARKDGAHNGPPDNYQDYADFVSALVSRYKTGSPYGQVHAIEVWNEPNIIVVTAGLSPTGVTNGQSADDVT